MTRFQPTGTPIGGLTRAMLIAGAAFLLSGFAVARRLEPDSRGFGTHQQLGLPECVIRTMFSRPCPGCGMTTCFSHFVRGEFVAAARANPAGVMLATFCVLLIPWCLLSASQGCLWLVDDPMAFVAAMIAVIGLVASLSWLLAIWRNA